MNNASQNGSLWKRTCHRYNEWYKLQTTTRLVLFCAGYTTSVVLFAWLAYKLSHPPHHLILREIVAFGICEAAFFILWPLVTLKFKRNGRNISSTKLLCWWLVTIWVSFFVSTTQGAQPSPSSAPVSSIVQSTDTASTAVENPGVQPHGFECSFWLFLFIIVIASIFIGMLWYLLCKLGFCGNKGNRPPQSPGNEGDNIVFQKGFVKANLVINTNIPLPTTVFYLSGGIIVSNSAGLQSGIMPPFMSINGSSVPSGAELSTAVPGSTTPPTIAFWMETNTFYDLNLDSSHAYVAIYNYSVLTATNLTGPWRELCTVVGWINNNIQVPLVCSITYTNGIALTTNWSQCYLDNTHQPTNIVVYGALPSLAVENPPLFTTATGSSNTNGTPPPPPPGSGGSGCTNCSPSSSTSQFYKLTCNTNDVVTSWP